MTQTALTPDPWSHTLAILKDNLSSTSYETWFKPMKIIVHTEDKMVLGIDDHFALSQLRQRYYTLVSNAIKEAYNQEYELVFVNTKDPLPKEYQALQLDGNASDVMLNPKYTFDTFVVGASNRFAHAASLAVAELPSDAYNPLFIYGGVGLGKTHLMHAIGHYIISENPSTKLMYTTSENFTNQLIEAISKKTNKSFREKLRNVDVLMVDDIQFIAGKTSTQEEFFHTFNQLHGSGKQIIISSDRPPKDIPTLEERLRSRFEWGLIADIQKPDYETRIAILKKKAEDERIDIPVEVLHLIAERVESNIRELEGSLTRINAAATLNHEPVTLEMAEKSLDTISKPRGERRLTPEVIMEAVADYYHLEVRDLLSPRRNREIAMPRQIAMHLTREMTGLSTTRIGAAFGGRDHTTVMHACDKIVSTLKQNPQLRSTIEQIKSDIDDR